MTLDVLAPPSSSSRPVERLILSSDALRDRARGLRRDASHQPVPLAKAYARRASELEFLAAITEPTPTPA